MPKLTAPTLPTSLLGLTVVAVLSSLLASGCSNDLERFCEDATGNICHKCFSCAANDDEASTLCGLLVVTDEAGCMALLHEVCAADDSAYNAETGRACQERISKLECEPLQREGKPEVCGRLF